MDFVMPLSQRASTVVRWIHAGLLATALQGCSEPEDLDETAQVDAAQDSAVDVGGRLDAAQSMNSDDAGEGPDSKVEPPLEAAAASDDGSAQPTDAAPLQPGSSSETTCLAFRPNPRVQDESCPGQVCMAARSSFLAEDGQLTCDTNEDCKLPSDPSTIGMQGAATIYSQSFSYANDDVGVSLGFNNEILRGYSLENFRRFSLGPDHGFVYLVSDGKRTRFPVFNGETEFLDYSQGKLHFRLQGEVVSYETTKDVDPYVCESAPIFPTVCDFIRCNYDSHNSAQPPAQITIEGNLTIEPPTM